MRLFGELSKWDVLWGAGGKANERTQERSFLVVVVMFTPSKMREVWCLKAALLAEYTFGAWEQALKEKGLQTGMQEKAATLIINHRLGESF